MYGNEKKGGEICMRRRGVKHRRSNYYTISRFICPECNNIIPLPRRKCKEKGHKKKIYCPYCKMEQNFKEIKENEFISTLDQIEKYA